MSHTWRQFKIVVVVLMRWHTLFQRENSVVYLSIVHKMLFFFFISMYFSLKFILLCHYLYLFFCNLITICIVTVWKISEKLVFNHSSRFICQQWCTGPVLMPILDIKCVSKVIAWIDEFYKRFVNTKFHGSVIFSMIHGPTTNDIMLWDVYN